ncbi:hypothetical protein [Verticiella sediminum]|uniref:hypothetical protein n=1 Tax=Verticiella sediminum TaxID=1247510 RepID=UPI003CCC57E1
MGDVIGMVTESVYDTATGRYLLIPQGSRFSAGAALTTRVVQPEPVWNKSLVPGAGIEPARLAAGDFESVIYSVSTGKWGEF